MRKKVTYSNDLFQKYLLIWHLKEETQSTQYGMDVIILLLTINNWPLNVVEKFTIVSNIVISKLIWSIKVKCNNRQYVSKTEMFIDCSGSIHNTFYG